MAVDISGDSPEAIAYRLMVGIASNEGKHFGGGFVTAERKWILETYWECLHVVKSAGATKTASAST